MIKKKKKPFFKHDCKACVFLDSLDYGDTKYDLYFCDQGMFMKTVIVRFSDSRPDYYSGLFFALNYDIRLSSCRFNPLNEAYKLAIDRGFIYE